jgi:hypothetical protein
MYCSPLFSDRFRLFAVEIWDGTSLKKKPLFKKLIVSLDCFTGKFTDDLHGKNHGFL